VLPKEAADVLLGFVREKKENILALYDEFQREHDANGMYIYTYIYIYIYVYT
jgi:hypothetical protein